jgi:protein tyrosine phosphatase (PTP) superfamily phosphohydrolase (DUF442 family)
MTTNIEDSYNYRMVSDRLTTSGVVGAKRLKALASQGYEAVVNLLPDASEHAIADERDIVESQRLEYIYIPVDFKAPRRSDFTRFSQALDRLSEKKIHVSDFTRFSQALDRLSEKKIHVHCAANYRVSAFYSLYAVSRGRWSPDQAREFIRSVWRPADHPGWSGFIDELLGELKS